jgi:hypothetical protein
LVAALTVFIGVALAGCAVIRPVQVLVGGGMLAIVGGAFLSGFSPSTRAFGAAGVAAGLALVALGKITGSAIATQKHARSARAALEQMVPKRDQRR